MTEKNANFFYNEVLKLIPITKANVCVPKGIIASTFRSLPEDFLRRAAKESVLALDQPKDGPDMGWLRFAKIFYPDTTFDQIQFRSSSDPYFSEIMNYVRDNKMPTLFIIERINHAVGTSFKKGDLDVATIHYARRNKMPRINFINRQILNDTSDIAKTIFDGCPMVVFPPESEIKVR
ncbi:hypothetical protein KKD37_02790 [Patescibacteria group bacterium]|nr:hypothetical protein [Patescibacteria group bacterium]